MKVKLGDQWFEAVPNFPIMVQLTQKDRENIANMVTGADRYALFHKEDESTVEEKRDWMNEGYEIELQA